MLQSTRHSRLDQVNGTQHESSTRLREKMESRDSLKSSGFLRVHQLGGGRATYGWSGQPEDSSVIFDLWELQTFPSPLRLGKHGGEGNHAPVPRQQNPLVVPSVYFKLNAIQPNLDCSTQVHLLRQSKHLVPNPQKFHHISVQSLSV